MKKFLKIFTVSALIICALAYVKFVYIGNYSTDEAMLEQLRTVSENSDGAKEILKHSKRYPESLVELAVRNPETIDFVSEYPKRMKYSAGGLAWEDVKTERKVPLFLQWDKRWGYSSYNKNFMALSGCGPTSVSMAAVYLTGDINLSPRKIAAFSEENSYCVEGNGTSWTLMTEGCKKLGFAVREIPLVKNEIFDSLSNDRPIICHVRKGDFTTTGHYIVFAGVQDNKIIVNDPNSVIKSDKLWAYEDIKDQIINMWELSIPE